jgi:NAD(P)-dependent dehydrogenase (short-subunit alcohol dehydrogenase family)
MTDGPASPAELFGLTDRVAVVTGASSGLGDRFARVLHRAGASVVAAARRRDRLDALAAELPGVVPVQVDVTDAADLDRLVQTTVDRFGRVDVLVNNAGGGSSGPAEDEVLDDFVATLHLNVVGLFELSRLIGRHMLDAGRGSIVNVASVFGLVSAWPLPNGGYVAAKGAVVSLTRELGCQWADRGVRVNALAPGFFPSEAMDPALADESFAAYVRRHCPMRRPGGVHELDGALLFLASDASTYVTGQVLTVDGGWTAH